MVAQKAKISEIEYRVIKTRHIITGEDLALGVRTLYMVMTNNGTQSLNHRNQN